MNLPQNERIFSEYKSLIFQYFPAPIIFKFLWYIGWINAQPLIAAQPAQQFQKLTLSAAFSYNIFSM
jgi:hypothetical protein